MRTCSSTGTIELGNLGKKFEEVRMRSNEEYRRRTLVGRPADSLRR